ncbi:hypothetical protein QP932_08550 [Corynebacterium freneyi]|uniref:Uncharacterized protein n=1 Tax=Corynebacterium freneyi DNF00450 TaxID=1287475 RepID=A0A095Y914_9CORY|nr:hypothetical protein [Corynebacterium freneyi]KGF18576.1 hypothetical protein HMPREF1650_01360 [Corynebacterium freneyi DNF00450]MDK8768547.1 hypothetical protein [Corynebacterium freneyi]
MSRNDEAHAAEAAADTATTADGAQATTGKAPAVLATGSIPAGDADVVAALLDGEFTLAEIDDALDAYEGTGMDRCLTAAMELRALLHDGGWYFAPDSGLVEFLLFPSDPAAVDAAPTVTFGVEWPTNPITGLPRAVHDVSVSAPLPDDPDSATAIRFRSVKEFAPYAAAVKDPDPDNWPAELQGRRFDPDDEIRAYAEQLSKNAADE